MRKLVNERHGGLEDRALIAGQQSIGRELFADVYASFMRCLGTVINIRTCHWGWRI